MSNEKYADNFNTLKEHSDEKTADRFTTLKEQSDEKAADRFTTMKTYDDDAEKKNTKENRIISGVAVALAFAVTTAGIVLTNNKEPVVDAKQNPKEITAEPAAKKDSVSSISFEAVHKMYQSKTR